MSLLRDDTKRLQTHMGHKTAPSVGALVQVLWKDELYAAGIVINVSDDTYCVYYAPGELDAYHGTECSGMLVGHSIGKQEWVPCEPDELLDLP